MKKSFFTLFLLLFSCAAHAAQVEYTSQHLRDPFQSPFEIGKRQEAVGEAGIFNKLEVQGMIWGSKMPQAIINNTVVKAGDVLEGAEILDIRKEGVYIQYEGNQYIIRPTIK